MKTSTLLSTLLLSTLVLFACNKDKKTDAAGEDNNPEPPSADLPADFVGDEDTHAYDQEMGHQGSAHNIANNRTDKIDGTPWHFEQWCDQGSGSFSMQYYNNGTFKAYWNNVNEYIARVGFKYEVNGEGVDHNTKKYSADYKFTKTGSAPISYIGAYGWTVNPITEWYIVDDWYTKPQSSKLGKIIGSYTMDGAEYTVYALQKTHMPSLWGYSDFYDIYCVRDTPRQKGHLSLWAHFKRIDQVLKSPDNIYISSLSKFGNLIEVSLIVDALQYNSTTTGTIDFTYFDLKDN